MSENLSKVIGMAALNEEFRKSLLENPEKALKDSNLELNGEELEMVKKMKLEQLQEFTNSLDERISKSIYSPRVSHPGSR